MDVLALAAKLVKHFEGCRLTAYQDSAGVWTIGYGHTAGVTVGRVVSQAEADALLAEDLLIAEAAVSRLFPPLARVALIDFTFNLGAGATRQLLSHPDPENQFERWVHAGGEILPGLVKRRAVEAFLFSLGDLA